MFKELTHMINTHLLTHINAHNHIHIHWDYFLIFRICKLNSSTLEMMKKYVYIFSPCFQSVTASTITVKITPPSQPNGVVRLYNILVDGIVVSCLLPLHTP